LLDSTERVNERTHYWEANSFPYRSARKDVPRQYKKNRTVGLNQSAALFCVLALVIGLVMALGRMPLIGGVSAVGHVSAVSSSIRSAAATLGVFAGFEVTNFDVFLVCHNTSFAVLGLVFALCQ
jgi:hypothetical protein